MTTRFCTAFAAAVFTLLGVTVFPASRCLASTNILTGSDADALGKVIYVIISLQKEIAEPVNGLTNQPSELSLHQAACLMQLYNSLSNINAQLVAAADLVHLSAIMEDSGDEQKINSFLAGDLPKVLETIADSRSYSLSQVAVCSSSALVNTYAQKTAELADKATAAIMTVSNRVELAQFSHHQ